MTTINLIFSDNISVPISSTSFLFKYSDFFKSLDLEEEDIYIICPSSYILNETGTCLFDEKEDLTFMFKLKDDKFINMCLFLDIILYNQPYDEKFSIIFTKHLMTNYIIINKISCFMIKEIRDVNNYLNCISKELQVRICNVFFYRLYLQDTNKEFLLKYDRVDIYDNYRANIYNNYYKFNSDVFNPLIHKYNNNLSNILKNSTPYITYLEGLHFKLFRSCGHLNDIQYLIERGANKYIINENGENIMFNNDSGKYSLDTIKYLIEQEVPFIQNNFGNNILHVICLKCPWHDKYHNNIIRYLVENTKIDINTQNNKGFTALHYASINNNINCVKLLITHGANIRLKNNNNKTAFSLGGDEIKKYIQSIDSYYKRFKIHNDTHNTTHNNGSSGSSNNTNNNNNNNTNSNNNNTNSNNSNNNNNKKSNPNLFDDDRYDDSYERYRHCANI